MHFRDQTHLVNLDKLLTLCSFPEDVNDCSKLTAPVLALNQTRTHFKHNRCTVSTFFDYFEYALLIVCRLCKQTRHVNYSQKKGNVSGNRNIRSFVTYKLQITEINLFLTKKKASTFYNMVIVDLSRMEGKKGNSTQMIAKWITLCLL